MRCVAEAQLRNAARCYSGSCGPAARGLVTKGCCAAQHPQHEGIIVIGRSRAAGCARSFRSAGVACDWLVERCGLRAQRLRTVQSRQLGKWFCRTARRRIAAVVV